MAIGKKQKANSVVEPEKYVHDPNRKSIPLDPKILSCLVSYMPRREQMICLYMNKAFAAAVVPYLWEMIPLKKKSLEIAKILQIKITEGPLHTGDNIKETKKKKKRRVRRGNVGDSTENTAEEEKDESASTPDTPLPDKLPEIVLDTENNKYPPMFEYHTFVKIFNCENMDIWDDTTMKVLERCGTNVKQVLLLNVRFYNTALFAKTIALCCPNITDINFQGTRDLGKLILDTFLNSCSHINSLNLVNTSCKTGKSILDALKQMKCDKLISLKFGLNVDLIETNIRGARFLGSNNINPETGTKPNPDLVEAVDRRPSVLARQYPIDITNQISNYMVNLVVLTIFSGHEISAESLMQFAKVCNKLEELTLGCLNNNDEIMEMFLKNNDKKLKILEIIDCRDINETDAFEKKLNIESSEKINTTKNTAINENSDEIIELHEDGITKKTFQNIATYCTNLLKFSFDNKRKSFVYMETKTTYEYSPSDLATCFKNLPKLKVLKLSYNPVTDTEMAEIIKSCPNLCVLDIESCYWSLGKTSLSVLPHSLFSINCFIGKDITSDDIRDLIKKLPSLNNFVMFLPILPKPRPKIKKSKSKQQPVEYYDDWISLLQQSVEGYDSQGRRSSHIFLEGVLRSESLFHYKNENIQQIKQAV